jgi:hypothetical protein
MPVPGGRNVHTIYRAQISRDRQKKKWVKKGLFTGINAKQVYV